jgi:hypothetical protein
VPALVLLLLLCLPFFKVESDILECERLREMPRSSGKLLLLPENFGSARLPGATRTEWEIPRVHFNKEIQVAVEKRENLLDAATGGRRI